MIKKITLLGSLVLSSILAAQDYKYEITPVVGHVISEGNIGLSHQSVIGAEVQYNSVKCLLKPEISVLYSSDADYKNTNLNTDMYRFAINGVHEYSSMGKAIPFAKVGVGYETLNKYYADNKDSIFFDAGAGVKVPLVSNIALKLEAIYMLKNNENRWDSNLALLAGINFGFGAQAQKSAPVTAKEEVKAIAPAAPVAPVAETKVVAPVVEAKPQEVVVAQETLVQKSNSAAIAPVVIDGDNDKDGVLNSMDKCPTTPAGEAVNAQGCPVDGDDDKDGVLNSIDKCPTTPAGHVVDEKGCTKEVNLHINFKTNSSIVDEPSKVNVKNYAEFLKARSEYKTQIVGHTDSAGSNASNKKLSQKRAAIVKDLLVKEGVEAARIATDGMGEESPVTTNKTAAGRAQNRRIEAKLIKN